MVESVSIPEDSPFFRQVQRQNELLEGQNASQSEEGEGSEPRAGQQRSLAQPVSSMTSGIQQMVGLLTDISSTERNLLDQVRSGLPEAIKETASMDQGTLQRLQSAQVSTNQQLQTVAEESGEEEQPTGGEGEDEEISFLQRISQRLGNVRNSITGSISGLGTTLGRKLNFTATDETLGESLQRNFNDLKETFSNTMGTLSGIFTGDTSITDGVIRGFQQLRMVERLEGLFGRFIPQIANSLIAFFGSTIGLKAFTPSNLSTAFRAGFRRSGATSMLSGIPKLVSKFGGMSRLISTGFKAGLKGSGAVSQLGTLGTIAAKLGGLTSTVGSLAVSFGSFTGITSILTSIGGTLASISSIVGGPLLAIPAAAASITFLADWVTGGSFSSQVSESISQVPVLGSIFNLLTGIPIIGGLLEAVILPFAKLGIEAWQLLTNPEQFGKEFANGLQFLFSRFSDPGFWASTGQSLWSGLKTGMSSLFSGLLSFGGVIETIIGTLVSLPLKLTEGILRGFSDIPYIGPVFSGLANIIGPLGDFLQAPITRIVQGLGAIIPSASDIASMFGFGAGMMESLTDTIVDTVTQIPFLIPQAILQGASSLAGMFGFTTVASKINGISSTLSGVQESISSFLQDPLGPIIDAVMSPIQTVQTALSGIRSVVQSLGFNSITSAISSAFLNALMGGVPMLLSGVTAALESVFDMFGLGGVADFFGQASDFFFDPVGVIQSGMSGLFTVSTIRSAITGGFQAAMDAIGFIESIQKAIFGLPGDIVSFLLDSAAGLADQLGLSFVASTLRTTSDAIQTITNTVADFLANPIGFIVDGLMSFWNNIKGSIPFVGGEEGGGTRDDVKDATGSEGLAEATEIVTQTGSGIANVATGNFTKGASQIGMGVGTGTIETLGGFGEDMFFAEGGVIREPVTGVTASGRKVRIAERGPEAVVPIPENGGQGESEPGQSAISQALGPVGDFLTGGVSAVSSVFSGISGLFESPVSEREQRAQRAVDKTKSELRGVSPARASQGLSQFEGRIREARARARRFGDQEVIGGTAQQKINQTIRGLVEKVRKFSDKAVNVPIGTEGPIRAGEGQPQPEPPSVQTGRERPINVDAGSQAQAPDTRPELQEQTSKLDQMVSLLQDMAQGGQQTPQTNLKNIQPFELDSQSRKVAQGAF